MSFVSWRTLSTITIPVDLSTNVSGLYIAGAVSGLAWSWCCASPGLEDSCTEQPRIRLLAALWSGVLLAALWSGVLLAALWSGVLLAALWSGVLLAALWSGVLLAALWSGVLLAALWSGVLLAALWSGVLLAALWSGVLLAALWSGVLLAALWSGVPRVTYLCTHAVCPVPRPFIHDLLTLLDLLWLRANCTGDDMLTPLLPFWRLRCPFE